MSQALPSDRDVLLWDIAMVSEALSVSRRTIWKWSSEGKLHPLRLGPKTVRWRRSEIVEWLDSME